MTEIVTAADIYWLTRLDPIGDVLCGAAFFGLFLGVFGSSAGYAGGVKRMRVLGPIMLAIGALCAVGQAFVPTTKEMCAIVVIPKLANSQEVQGLGSEVVTLAREWLNELRPAK